MSKIIKRCPRCSNRYSDLWNICIECKIPLIKESVLAKIFTKTDNSFSSFSPSLERIIDQSEIFFLYLDNNLKPVICNSAVEYITGYSREEIFKDDWQELFFRENSTRREIFKAVITSCFSSVKSRPYKGVITRKDGSECMLYWKNTMVTDKSGRASGIICTAQDITEYKSSEDDLAAKSEHLRDIFTSIKNYVLITANLRDKITYYGVNSKELFGWKDDMVLEDISVLFPEPERNNTKEKIKHSVREYGKFEKEVDLVRQDKKVFPAQLMVNALYDKENKKIGYVYVARDITEKKKIERQMVQNEKLAAIGQLAAGIAHEMNNPLLVILGRLDILSTGDEKLNPNVERTIDIVKAQAQRMRIIVDRLLFYSRQKAVHKDPLSINEILMTVIPLLAYHPEFKKISCRKEFAKDLPKIRGNSSQLEELFFNLGLNACQAMPEGGIMTVTSKDTKDKFIEVAIGDTGSGIKKEDLNKLFTPFFTTKDDGTGLGLPICQNIVNTHKGKIEVESEEGKGTTFRIKLPAI